MAVDISLSPHFSYAELIKSQTAARLGISNIPGPQEIDNLRRVATGILEPVRMHFRRAVVPSSGYRCRALNRAVHSGDGSQHIKGEAVDFEIPGIDNASVARWIAGALEFDQLILEFYNSDDPSSGWIHCSLKESGNRRKFLTF